uniref:Uncharacterized protein n=1 Tax=Arundo donax TaxID=35708 RepID=A0A0A9QCM1_ARUDO
MLHFPGKHFLCLGRPEALVSILVSLVSGSAIRIRMKSDMGACFLLCL